MIKIRLLALPLILSALFSASAAEDVSDIFEDLNDPFVVSEMPPAPELKPPESTPIIIPSMAPTAPTPPSSAAYTVNEMPVEKKTPSFLSMEETLSLAKEAFADDEWDKSQSLFESVLAQDAYNTTAIKWLKRIALKKNSRERKNYTTTRTRMLENVQAAWNTPKTGEPIVDKEADSAPASEDELRAQALQKKLESIRIPSLAFQNAGIQQVVLELTSLCKQLDSDGVGINLVVFGTTETLLPPVTFSGTDLSVLEALDIITQMSGTKYEIGPNLVSLTPVNYEPPQQMVATEFDVMPSVGGKISLLNSDGNMTDNSGLIDARGFFSTVPFPAGASAQYNPEFNILLVRNSPKHLDKIEALLSRYNQKALDERSRQVEIETKFIEVAEGALEELGFDWLIGEGQDYINSDTWGVEGDQRLFTDSLRSGETAFSRGIATAGQPTSFNSYAGSVTDPIGDGLIGTAAELTIKKVTGTPIEIAIKALERQAGSDLLSAPKVLTKSGETATIHVGEVHWFPTAFDVELEREAQPVLVPLDYEEEKTGVMLEVTPELDPENGTIDLELSPEIRELAGYDAQHVATLWPFFNSGGTSANAFELTSTNLTGADIGDLLSDSQGAADRLIARRPIFKSRKVETKVTIEDGSTIAMGGLIKEKLETFKDSVPILGKVPLLGRLFRSEGERSVKRNLVIFVTANQVDASGYKKTAK
jgi:general secretion pathway protein D